MKKLYAKNELNFANDTNLTTEMHLLHLVVLILIAVAYTLILTRTIPMRVDRIKRRLK